MASYTRQQWSTDLLRYIGNSAPSPYVLAFVIAWTAQETGGNKSAAKYNLLNTTQPEPGSTYFNCLRRDAAGNCTFGVQNFATYSDGITANGDTLMNGRYPTLYPALRDNDSIALGSLSGQPSQGIIDDLATWGTHNWRGIIANLDNQSLPGQTFTSSVADVVQAGIQNVAQLVAVTDVAQGLSRIDLYSTVVNPFNVNTDFQVPQGWNFINPLAWIGDATSNVLNWIGAVGNNIVLDLRGLAIRLLIVIVGFGLLASVLLQIINVSFLTGRVKQALPLPMP
jgi:hypothetical protein